MKICSCCNKTTDNYIKIRGGAICRECADMIPQSLADSLRELNQEQVREIKTLIDKGKGFHERPKLVFSKKFGVSVHCLWLDGKPFPVSAIEKAEADFHPLHLVRKNCVSGYTFIRIFLKKSRMVIEHQIRDKEELAGYSEVIVIRHNITHRDHIQYDLPEEIRKLADAINSAAASGGTLNSYAESFFIDPEEEKKKAEREKAERERAAREKAEYFLLSLRE